MYMGIGGEGAGRENLPERISSWLGSRCKFVRGTTENTSHNFFFSIGDINLDVSAERYFYFFLFVINKYLGEGTLRL